MDNNRRIWQATVTPTPNIVPRPGNSSQEHAQDVFTKTSLVADSNLRSLNREILSASQSYNNTPKPFMRDTQDSAKISNLRSTYTTTPVIQSDVQQVKLVQQSAEPAQLSTDHAQGQVGNRVQTTSQEENMAPQKLVHNQYNSPIDLYSMNNIRKTIEAHSELIAPGIKGINFMKPETPVNKQSEVYKLIKEEEELQQHQRASRLSPISGQPVSRPCTSGRSMITEQHCEQHQNVHHQTQDLSRQNQPQTHSNVKYCKIATQSSEGEQHGDNQAERRVAGPGAPSCCECGQFIIGPFAKIHNRFVHPQCFNCTTCGTSLKNIGYFMVNEKLYCEIHAKQVAKVMRIHFDFDEKQDHQQSSQSSVNRQQQQNVSSSNHSGGKSVTISTMFANRDNQQMSHNRQEMDWSWAPTSTGSTNRISITESDQMPYQRIVASSSQQQDPSNMRRSPTPIAQTAQQQQSMLSSGRLIGRGSLLQEESTPVGARTPICVHCHVRIQGPYVLAGRSTWCKLCSQNNFQCSSCYRSLLDTGFIEDSSHKYYCEHCFEAYYAPICSKCNIRIKGDCLNALNKQWHPSCFVCGHCHRPFGNSSFYLEDNVPYCERDWNVLFTTKCFACSNPIEAGDKWIEALNRNYHSNCFRCSSCQANLEGSTFYCKGGRPYCRLHIR